MAMKPKYEEKTIVDMIGKLDIIDGEKVIVIELKDETIIKKVDDVIESMVGTMVQFKSVEE